MLFNSFAFLFVFLPACLAVYFLLGRLKVTWPAMTWLLVASFAFYSYWNAWHTLILLGSVSCNSLLGATLVRRPSKFLLWFGVIANLTLLGIYKYLGFFLSTLRDIGVPASSVSLALPIGISFYTFVQIAFLIDAYHGRAHDLNIGRYGLFVSLFPHSLAGPLVHHTDLMPQFRREGATLWQWQNVSQGIGFFCIGLAKKVLIADTFASWANPVFDAADTPAVIEAWVGALSYTFQLYFDFSGYSDMAIGLGLLVNVRFPENFNAPYQAASIIEFWRRWHMTLSRWLRDYLYIPLGGNRCSTPRIYLNLFLTMLLGGIWHGAGWTFAVWGAYHGLLLIANHLIGGIRQWAVPPWLARPTTFALVVVGWVFFRASDLGRANQIVRAMMGGADFRLESLAFLPDCLQAATACIAGLIAVNIMPTTQALVARYTGRFRFSVALAVLFLVCLWHMRAVALNLKQSQFIYFQF